MKSICPRAFSVGLALILCLSPAAAFPGGALSRQPGAPAGPDFSAVDDCLLMSREAAPFSIAGNFCETVYLPARELDAGESHIVGPEVSGAAPGTLRSLKIALGGDASNFDIAQDGLSATFRLKSAPDRGTGAPLDYTLMWSGAAPGKIIRVARGTIFPVKSGHRAMLRFINNEDLAAAAAGGYEVAIAGDMNGWDPKVSPLRYDAVSGEYAADLGKIKRGRYKYKFVIGGKWVPDRSNPAREADGFGSFNSVLTVGEFPAADVLTPVCALRERGFTRLSVRYEGGSRSPALAVFFKGIPLPPGSVSYDPATRLFNAVIDERGFADAAAVKPSIMFYSYTKTNAGALETLSPEYCFYRLPGHGGTYNFRDGVIYFAMTDRFANGDRSNDAPLRAPGLHPKCDFHGGDIDGVLKAAESDYFSSLGVNLLWISPVLAGNGRAFRDSLPPREKFSNYHGYWPYSLDEAEPRLGSFEKIARAVKTIRDKYSIEVIADAVFRHVTIDSPVYKRNRNLFLGLRLPDGSKNVRRFDEYPETTWFDDFLPAFDYSKKEAVEFMKAKADGWIEKSGVRGFRLDAVKHIPHGFWRELLGGRENFFTVGETIDGRDKIASYIGPGMLTAQFDFPLYFAIVEAFTGKGGAGFERLDAEIRLSEQAFWHSHKLTSNLIGNHDFPRFMAYADGWFAGGANGDGKRLGFENPPRVRNPRNYARLTMAWGLIFALNGMPLIYYGDEYGECGAGDPDNRRPMRFNGELNAFEKRNLDTVKKISAARKASPALIEGARVTLFADADRYAFAKIHFNETVIAAFNKSDKAAVIDVRCPAHPCRPGSRAVCFYDMITGEKFSAESDGGLRIPMRPLSFRYLEILR